MCTLFINALSIFMNVSDKEIVVYIPVNTRNFSLFNHLQTGTGTHTPSYPKRLGRKK
jgi:hypothetical protein